MYGVRDFVAGRRAISYGFDLIDLYRRAGSTSVAFSKATNRPTSGMQPTKFELVINLKTAKALGLEVPPTLLARADEVIE